MRDLLGRRSQLNVRLIAPDEPSDALAKYLDVTPVLKVAGIEVTKEGDINARGYKGNFVNGGFELSHGACLLTINEVTAKFLSGNYVCPRMEAVAARIELE